MDDEEKLHESTKSSTSLEKTQDPPNSEPFDEELTCSLYVSRANDRGQGVQYETNDLSKSNLEEAIHGANLAGTWEVSETSCGLIAAFSHETDADKLLQRGDLARVFEGPVQVARFSARDSRYRQAVLLRDVPWAIPLQDLKSALTKQGIAIGNIERSKQYVRVEVFDAGHYEQLLRQGLDFFGATRFTATPERWWRGPMGQFGNPGQNLLDSPNIPQGDGVLQCYRCQGFWHIAANCRHLPRCVRCGESHSVEFCPRPRNNPICCHCSGPHHAGYRQCPVRLQLSNATPISITLSTSRIADVQYPLNIAKSAESSNQGQQPLKPNQS